MKNTRRFVAQCARSLARKINFARMRNPLVALFVVLGLTAIVTFSTTGYAERLINKLTLGAMQNRASLKPGKPTLATDKGSYLAGETITFTGTNWAPGEAVTITVTADSIKDAETVQVTADKSGSFMATMLMPDAREVGGDEKSGKGAVHAEESEEGGGNFTATARGASSKTTAEARFVLGIADRDGERLLEQESYWIHRLSYPTGRFDPAWVRKAAEQDSQITRSIPAGRKLDIKSLQDNPLALSPIGFTALGPQPERMTGCSGCFDYTTTEGRVNAIAVDPTTTTPGSVVAYIATVGGGVWKTTNCCSGSTSWTAKTDDALVSTTSVDSVIIDPNNHNTIYAGTGDLNYGSFSMGSQGILKSTDAGATWTVLGASVFGAALPEPAGQFPQYNSVGKVRVDPNNSNNVVVGTKVGLYLSYDGGNNWTGPCLTNTFTTMRQDITGLELSNLSGTTRVLAAVGTRGFATTVQYNLDQNGANGIYKGTLPASGCPTDFTSIATNANGFVFGATVAGSPYTTGANINAGTGSPYAGTSTGDQAGRIDLAVAPSDPNYIYAQVGSIAANNNAGCGNTAGCQLGVWVSINGGTSWTFMAGSAGGALRNCVGGNTSGNPGDYPQNWYDQGMAVDPNNPDRVFIDTYDTWFATRTGTALFNITCGYNGGAAAAHVVHVDHHALAFVPGSSNILLEGSDGGIFSSSNANTTTGSVRPTWVNMDTGINTIEFYSGDISGNFATSANPQAVGGAQDNGPSSVTFSGSPTGGVQWQMGLGGDGFFSRIDPVGTGTNLRFFEGNNSGGMSRCILNCTASGASWSSVRGNWTGDTQSFVLPWDIFHGGIPGGDNCAAAGTPGGCGHLIAATTRVYETIAGGNATMNAASWYITNTPTTQNMTKGTLGNRSFINQVKYSPKYQSVAILGTNDANVWIGFNLGTGVASQANWVNVTGGNTVLPNRPVLNIALDPTVAAANTPVGYAAVGGFNENTPTQPGHVFRVDCDANCATPTWTDKSGNLPNIPVDAVIVNPNFPQQVFAGSDFGLYYTDNVNAASPLWYRFNIGLPNVMIWDMQIDRGSTTLSLWTRSRGAFVWPLPLGALNPPSVVAAPASGPYAGTANLSATMTSGGQPVPGKTIAFALNGNAAGSAVTNGSGVATVSNASLTGINAGNYPTGVGASFTADANYAAASGTNALTVNIANQTITVNTHAPASAQHDSSFVVATTSDSGLPVAYSSSGSCTNIGATFTMTSGSGICTVHYNQAGDSNYNPAPEVTELVNALECVGLTNVAAPVLGGTATASTELLPSYPASGVINGEHDGTDWGTGGGWNDNTPVDFSNDRVQANLSTLQSLDEIDVYTLQDQFGPGAPPVTDATTFTLYGITDFDVQTSSAGPGGPFTTVPGGTVVGNNLAKRKFVFGSPITANAVRVVVHDSADHYYSRVVEIEAFSCNPAPCPGTNVALATYGGTTSASTALLPAYPASGVNNGEHNGTDWGAGGGWNDNTPTDFSNDYVQVDLNALQTLTEIDVYTLQDQFGPGAPPVTNTTTFTLYGNTNFEVQTSTGGPFTTIAGGNVVGNNLVKRRFIFPMPITASSIRVVVHDSADHYFSRVVEIEAFSCNPATPTPSPSPSPTPTPCATNLALPANGGTASASSETTPNYPASGVINGEHDGTDWGAGGGWNDATGGDFSNDYVQVNLDAIHTLDEVDVYTLQDANGPGAPPVTDSTTFTTYGITAFEVQTSTDGTTFTTIPGGNITGNNLVKRKFLFASPISASDVRVLVHDSADHYYSRVVEIEARSCNPTQIQRVVDDDHVQCPTAAYTNITDAINASSAGDIIQVCAGSYNEQANISKTLTIRGPKSGQDARTRVAPLGQEAVIKNICGPVRITADNVTVDGFIIQGANNTCVGGLGTGVHTRASNSGHQILNNIIQNNTMGVYLQNGGATQAKVRQNLIRNNNNAGAASGVGVYSDSGLAKALIDNNTFFGQSDSAVFMDGTQSDLFISNNDLGGGAVLAANTTTASITGNKSTGTTGFWFDQIRLFGGNSGITISCNTLNGGVRGIRVSAENGVNTAITINDNNIQGHSQAGLKVDGVSDGSAYTGTLNGENNWWGSATGPTIASNPGGTGDAILDEDLVVDYTPYATASDPCAPPLLPGGADGKPAAAITKAGKGQSKPGSFKISLPSR